MKYFTSVLFAIFAILITTNSSLAQNSSKNNSQLSGIGIMKRLPGIWRGPVISNTPAGNFDHWYIDLRPVAHNQVAQFSNLDDNTVNNFSFFFVKHKGQKRLAFRTEGCFANSCCITYEILDSVNEAMGYYRFADFVSGPKRAFTEFRFTNDSMIMEVYTNRFNTEEEVKLHTRWEAKLMGVEAAQAAIKEYKFPKLKKLQDFTGVFNNLTESIFFTFENDPYKSEDQPNTGSATFKILIDENIKLSEKDQILVLLTIKPLWSGQNYLKENEKYFVRAVYLKHDVRNYTLKNIHPGNYYVYYFIDKNSDYKYITGDSMSTESEKTLNIETGKTAEFVTKIDFVIE